MEIGFNTNIELFDHSSASLCRLKLQARLKLIGSFSIFLKWFFGIDSFDVRVQLFKNLDFLLFG